MSSFLWLTNISYEEGSHMENHGEVEEAVTYTSTDRDSKLVDT